MWVKFPKATSFPAVMTADVKPYPFDLCHSLAGWEA